VKLDRDQLVAEYGRNLADQIIAEAGKGSDVETRPAVEEPEER